MANILNGWGTITELSRQFQISRTFVYMLASKLDVTSNAIFGANAPADIPESATEMELARLLSFPQGEIVVNDKSYLVEDGTIYRLIQGRRYRPRCRDQEMEQIFPRIVFAELFRKGSVEVAKENLPILDRFGHALRWGSLKDHDLNIAVYGNTPAFAHTTASLAQSRAEWARDYILELLTYFLNITIGLCFFRIAIQESGRRCY